MAKRNLVKDFVVISGVLALITFLFAAFLNIYVAFLLRTSSEFSNLSVPSLFSFWICAATFIALGTYWKFSPEALQTEKATNFQNGIFFLACAITSFSLFRSQDFWPSFLGGSGSVKAIFENYPYLPVSTYGTWFFMVFFGYWVYNLRHLKSSDKISTWIPNIITVLSACLFFVLFLSNNLRFFIVFSFILSVYNTWHYVDKALYENHQKGEPALFRFISFVVVMILFAVLKIAAFGALVVSFWMADGDSKSWALKVDMNLVRLTLSVLLASYVWWFYDQIMIEFRLRLDMMKNAQKKEGGNLIESV